MGFIQLKLPKRLKLKLSNTSSLRKAREEYRQWLERERFGQTEIPRALAHLSSDPGEERTGVR